MNSSRRRQQVSRISVVCIRTERDHFKFSSVQFIDSMPQLNDRMTEQICRQWKRTKRHQSALTIALKLGLEKQ